MLSIIVPIFNAENTLVKSVESILKQKYQDFELILVDDGSSDRTAEICKSFVKSDSRVKYFYQENKGVSAARNIGIKNSTGCYIAFVDADDSVHPNMYVRMIERLDNADLVSCSMILNGVPLKQSKPVFNDVVLSVLLDKNCKGFACNKVFKAGIIKENNILFDEHIHMSEDMLFCLQYAVRAKHLARLSEAYYYYDLSENSASVSTVSMKKLTAIDAYKKAIEILEPKYERILRNQLTNFAVLSYRKIVKSKQVGHEAEFLISELENYNKNFLFSKNIQLKDKLIYILFVLRPALVAYV